MSKADTDPASDSTLRLPELLDIAFAEELLTRILELSSRCARVTLDASGVDRLSTPCAQILVAAAAEDGAFRLEAPSAAFTAALTDLGLAQVVEEWMSR